MNIHETALQTFGIRGRVEKLREESIELALACERYLAGIGGLHAVVCESADVSVVIESISTYEPATFAGAFMRGEIKLRKALDAVSIQHDNVNAQ